jgi:peptide/nickel transport system substrate-binding protein
MARALSREDGGSNMRPALAALGQSRRRRGALGASGAIAALASVLAACGPVSSAASGWSATAASTNNTVTYAMQPGGQATYPFPLISAAHASAANLFNLNDFQYLMYRPLYWFGEGVTPYLNEDLSLAYRPTYSGHQVTIRLKPYYKWSNGQPVDARDVVFWMHMMTAAGTNEAYYSPTGLPTDVTNVRAQSEFVMTMDITTPKYSESWFNNNMLSEITPMPLTWDRTQNGPSDCATRASSCTAVFNYLTAQSAMNPSTFASSPLWSVVDGPWKIKSLTSQGALTMTFNPAYSGPVKPRHITTFIEVPFTTDQAEYNVLQDPNGSQAIDIGYLPTVDAPVPPAGARVGTNPSSLPSYRLSAFYPWELSYFPYNFQNNTGQAPIFNQLYFRTAFQSLVDQEGVINGPIHGYGQVTTGPVGNYPVTQYLSPEVERAGDPWTLNILRIATLLREHGWSVVPNGIDTCQRPGTGEGDCGSGIAEGTKLSFSMIYATGLDWMESSARELASNASLVGIQISLTAEPFNDVTATAFSTTDHSWQLAEWGSWTYEPDYLPTGDELFESKAPINAGQYSNPHNDQLIVATLEARTAGQFDTAMYTWQNYLYSQLPVVYEPDVATLVEAVKGLYIGPENSASTITPEDWYYQK